MSDTTAGRLLPEGIMTRPIRLTISVALVAFALQLAALLFAGGRAYGSVDSRLREVEKVDAARVSERLARLEESRQHDHELLKDIHRLLLQQRRGD